MTLPRTPTRADAPEDPDRRPGKVAVATVGLALAGLAAWVALSEPTPPAAPRPPATTSERPAGNEPAPDGQASAGAEVDASPLAQVAWEQVDHPVDCAGFGVEVTDVVVADVTADGAPEALVTLRCAAGAGSPPTALFVYTSRPGTADPTLLTTLVRPEQDLLLTDVGAREGEVSATGTGYSGPGIPRCCPDRTVRLRWKWDGAALRPLP